MKKVSLMIVALALVLGLSQCKKDEKPAASGEKQHIVLSASLGDGNSKIAEDGIGGLKWAEGDVINVFKGEQSLSEDGLTCTDPENGIFEGEIATTTGNITFTFGTQNFDGQSGLLNDAISLTSGEVEYKADGNYNVRMTMPHAVLKLNVSALGTSGKLTISDGTSGVASVTNVTTPSEVFVAVPADGTQKNYTIGFGGKTATKVWTLAATFYTKSGSTTGEAIVIEPDTPAIPEGALPGLFTVGKGVDGQAGTDDDVKVYFSKGNLQCVKNGSTWDDNTCTWQFAAKQWETVETGTVDYANESVIGLFGWGSTGNAPVDDEYYVHYQPWSTDNSSTGHSSSYNYYGYGPSTNSLSPNLLVSNGSDWGANAISNGGNQAGKWRTLTSGEWAYLLNSRSTSYCSSDGSINRYAVVKVKGVAGMLLFPDGFSSWPSGAGTAPTTFNTYSSTWNSVDYDEDQFAVLQSAGCVFLPAAGYRLGTSVNNVGSYGYYWSSSYGNRHNAYDFIFGSDYVNPSDGYYRCCGRSVRLVSEN